MMTTVSKERMRCPGAGAVSNAQNMYSDFGNTVC